MNDLGYAVEWRVINAADYGCAQRRRRTFIFGYHKSTRFYKNVINNDLKNIVLDKGFYHDVFKSSINKKKKAIDFTFNNYKNLVNVSNKFNTVFRNAGVCINGKGITIEVIPKSVSPTPLSRIIEKEKVDDIYYLNSDEKKKFRYMRG